MFTSRIKSRCNATDFFSLLFFFNICFTDFSNAISKYASTIHIKFKSGKKNKNICNTDSYLAIKNGNATDFVMRLTDVMRLTLGLYGCSTGFNTPDWDYI